MSPAIPPAFGPYKPPIHGDSKRPSLPAAPEIILAEGYPMITVDGRQPYPLFHRGSAIARGMGSAGALTPAFTLPARCTMGRSPPTDPGRRGCILPEVYADTQENVKRVYASGWLTLATSASVTGAWRPRRCMATSKNLREPVRRSPGFLLSTPRNKPTL